MSQYVGMNNPPEGEAVKMLLRAGFDTKVMLGNKMGLIQYNHIKQFVEEVEAENKVRK